MIARLILISFFCMGSSFAMYRSTSLVHGYVGISAGAIKAEAKTDDFGNVASYSPMVGAIGGAEINFLFTKIGLEAFVEKAVFFRAENSVLDYKDPFYFGGKGKLMLNLIFFDGYIAAGYGREKTGEFGSSFVLAGLGVQAKVLFLGAFAELNYIETARSEGIKTRRYALLVGLKYYFL